MDYERALDIGRLRARHAAKAVRRWTGVEAMELCAVKAAPWPARWLPVGEKSYKEIARDDGYRGAGGYALLVTDESGAVKACSRRLYALAEAVKLIGRLPLPVAPSGELARALQEQDVAKNARDPALRVQV